jgi:phenylpyruvate tautomerase PptA (4-oxalocrotonate tautomerase family)
VKKKILVDILGGLSKAPGLNPENVMVCFKETLWENWSFAGGRLIHT